MAPQTRVFTDEQKAAAVARVLSGDAVLKVAKDVGVSPSTIRLWRAQQGGDPKTNDPDYRAMTLSYLGESLAAGERILRQTADAEWMGKQSAGELGVFLGIVFDKAARILAALGDGGAAGSDQVDTRSPGLPAPG
jgi:transposase-like protein